MLNRLFIPFSWLYGAITDLRNKLYDSNISTILSPSIYTINIGNLTVGGTGKTPHADYLLRRLSGRLTAAGALATLSRGYGRRTRGFRIAGPADTADTIGDEPLLLYRKHGGAVTVCVGEKRAEAIPQLLNHFPELRALVLDDAFQHRAVRPHLNILLMDYHRPFYLDHPFPAGRLRERRRGARRADVLIVSKCPDDFSPEEEARLRAGLQGYIRPETPVFFTGLRYGAAVQFAGPERTLVPGRKAFLVTGIAQPGPLASYVQTLVELAGQLTFADHHRYSAADLERIRETAPAGGVVLTTEKDFVKLQPLLAAGGRQDISYFYLPVDVRFIKDEEAFLERLFAPLSGGQSAERFPKIS